MSSQRGVFALQTPRSRAAREKNMRTNDRILIGMGFVIAALLGWTARAGVSAAKGAK